MEETDLSQLSEEEITDMYSDIIESGEVLAKAKSSPYCYTTCMAHEKWEVCEYPNNLTQYNFMGGYCR